LGKGPSEGLFPLFLWRTYMDVEGVGRESVAAPMWLEKVYVGGMGEYSG
jgi:hypothetical protein